jgi:hypothetical protein
MGDSDVMCDDRGPTKAVDARYMEKEGRGVGRERTRSKGPGTSEPGLNCRGLRYPEIFHFSQQVTSSGR